MSKNYFDIIKQYWDKPHTADLEARARYRAEGAQHERERIIKLITDNDVVGADWWIALIKGENK